MEGPISFWGYKVQESNLILPEHDDDDDDEDDDINTLSYEFKKENSFSRRSEYDRQAVYVLCAGTGVTQGPSPLYRVKAGPREP
jgi:hypothetical protein